LDVKTYISRINFSGKPEADLQTLRALHLNHLLNIPFENLDIHTGKKIILEPELLYSKIVLNKRGGFCYEMNGLFFEVLSSIGFKAKMVSARVYDTEEPGPEFDHMAIIVSLNNEEFLADVGFGESFLEPLKIQQGLVHKQNGGYYCIDKIDGENFKVISSVDGSAFSNMYRFSLTERKLSDFNQMCDYHQTSPESHFTRNRICTIARPRGRITLSGFKLIETNNGAKTETQLSGENEFNNKLYKLFNIDLNVS
jgi:N-hydroxyarylamine O-acetyltransferase